MQEARGRAEPKRQAGHSSGKSKLVLRETCCVFKNNYGMLKALHGVQGQRYQARRGRD